MKEKWKLDKPEAVVEAQEKRKGMNWLLESLVFLIVLVVSGIGQFLIMMLGQMLVLSQNAAFQAAKAAGDASGMEAALAQIGNSDLPVVISLFSNIGMILVALGFCKLIQKRGPATLGFRKKGALKEYLRGIVVGFFLFSAAILICVVTGAVKIQGISETFGIGMFLLFILGFMIQGMAEEVLCRGYFMVSLGRRNSMWAAIAVNALVFAALHLSNDGIDVLAFINLVLYGIFASVYFVKRGNIWAAGGFHSMWNLAQGNIYGILVSGIGTECTLLKSTAVEKMEIINGGAFGLEGGLAVTIVFLVGTLFLLLHRQSPKTA